MPESRKHFSWSGSDIRSNSRSKRIAKSWDRGKEHVNQHELELQRQPQNFPSTPPRERRQKKAAQAEEAWAEWSAIPRSSASAEAAPEVGAAVSAKVKRPYSEVSAQAAALLSQRGQAHLLGGVPQPATDGSGTAGRQEKRQRMAHIQENMKASDLAGNPQVFDQE